MLDSTLELRSYYGNVFYPTSCAHGLSTKKWYAREKKTSGSLDKTRLKLIPNLKQLAVAWLNTGGQSLLVFSYIVFCYAGLKRMQQKNLRVKTSNLNFSSCAR